MGFSAQLCHVFVSLPMFLLGRTSVDACKVIACVLVHDLRLYITLVKHEFKFKVMIFSGFSFSFYVDWLIGCVSSKYRHARNDNTAVLIDSHVYSSFQRGIFLSETN